MNLIELLNWRYATKKMDPSKAVPEEKIDRILEAVRLTATSSGLQPFELILVTNPEVRARLRVAANGQPQITDCSHLIVFAAWDNHTAERINELFDRTNAERGFTNEGWENYRKMLLGLYPPRPAEVNFEHTARQAYIGLGTALIAAANEGVDATPMEGFKPDQVDEILGLRARGLRSAVLLPLGYRHEGQDWLASLKKIRRSRANFVTEIR
jgi:nitroreductase